MTQAKQQKKRTASKGKRVKMAVIPQPSSAEVPAVHPPVGLEEMLRFNVGAAASVTGTPPPLELTDKDLEVVNSVTKPVDTKGEELMGTNAVELKTTLSTVLSWIKKPLAEVVPGILGDKLPVNVKNIPASAILAGGLVLGYLVYRNKKAPK
jgi:hypothetical protein